MFTHDPDDDGRFRNLRLQMGAQEAIERVIDP